MKVISIIQPWATLIALGEKRFETRSWSTKYRGELAIHASKKIDKDACKHKRFREALAKHGYDEKTLPTGVILATCRLVDCHQVIVDFGFSAKLEGGYRATDNEYLFGDYSQGRYAWRLRDVNVLTEPIPAKGKLNLWEHPLTEMVGEM
ncbi:ASCH domain-containing protein [Aneurinibacillus migulanus]|uniref:ASCH domain-containing protein n=1 Tax=Aneurinibacillus migulanus TaxID=47500 RepID=UPI0020A1AD20|nr:ASCH domain-containing protein [Aneurinibacillus migulanus]MCP1355449.1 ASCH domain-containing protein [Aneurinibacillus migulanus]